MRHRKIFACWVLMLVLAAGPGFAQQPKPDEHHPGGAPPSAAMPGGPMGGAGETPMMGMMRMMMGQDGMSGMPMRHGRPRRGTARLSQDRTQDHRRPAPALESVADTMRANAKTMGEMPGMMGSAQTGSLPERLATREKMMAAHLEALRKFKAAIDPLYAALSDEQKKTADELLMGPMGMM